MAIYQLGDKKPVIPASCYVSDEAVLIGSVILGENVSILPGAVLRADNEPITIGDGSNVQENSVLHTDPGFPMVVGARVTVGHKVILHGCTIGDDCLIGMNATVLNGAVVGAGSLVAAGAVVLEGTVIPPGSLVAGVPAKVRRELSAEEREQVRANATHYVELARRHREV